jgi:hypothetical protein
VGSDELAANSRVAQGVFSAAPFGLCSHLAEVEVFEDEREKE